MNPNRLCIGQNMAVIQKMLTAYLKVRLEPFDLSPTQFMFLLHLRTSDGISQENLNEKMQYDKGVIARTAKQLMDSHYIKRQVNHEDKRAYQLFLTDEAKAFFPTMDLILSEWNDTLLTDLSVEEVTLLNRTLEAIAQRTIQKVEKMKHEK